MNKKTTPQNTKWSLSEKITLAIAVLSLFISTYSTYVSWQAKKPKLSIVHETSTCNSGTVKCYKLYVYNNDDAPCFEFSIEFNREALGLPYLVRGYEKSSLFNSHIDNNKIIFPAMQYILLPYTGDKLWLGFLNKNEIANFAFIPDQKNNLDKKLKITCVDTTEIIYFN